MNVVVQNIQVYSNIRIITKDWFGLVWQFLYFVWFFTQIELFWTINYHFGEQWKFKYIRYHRCWTNEYLNIFVSINRSQMNIQIYLAWKKTNKYLYEWIYLTHTGPDQQISLPDQLDQIYGYHYQTRSADIATRPTRPDLRISPPDRIYRYHHQE